MGSGEERERHWGPSTEPKVKTKTLTRMVSPAKYAERMADGWKPEVDAETARMLVTSGAAVKMTKTVTE